MLSKLTFVVVAALSLAACQTNGVVYEQEPAMAPGYDEPMPEPAAYRDCNPAAGDVIDRKAHVCAHKITDRPTLDRLSPPIQGDKRCKPEGYWAEEQTPRGPMMVHRTCVPHRS